MNNHGILTTSPTVNMRTNLINIYENIRQSSLVHLAEAERFFMIAGISLLC